MSSFAKKGKRRSIKEHNKERLEEVTRILEELDYLAVELIKYSINEEKTINKEEIKELAQEWTEMPIGDLEVSLLWSKIQDFEKRANEQRRKVQGAQKEGDNPA
jgi:hypothetical protein